MSPKRVTFPASAKAVTCPRTQTNVVWPAPVDIRLNRLVARIAEAGGDTTRSQLLAAIVTTTDDDGTALMDRIARYRRINAGDAALDDRDPIPVPERRPGRRPR